MQQQLRLSTSAPRFTTPSCVGLSATPTASRHPSRRTPSSPTNASPNAHSQQHPINSTLQLVPCRGTHAKARLTPTQAGLAGLLSWIRGERPEPTNATNNAELVRQLKVRLLEQAVQDGRFGADTSSEAAQEIEATIDELVAAAAAGTARGRQGRPATEDDASALDGSWRLVYTSESSVHKIVRSLPVSYIGQRIEMSSQRVTNMIDFGAVSDQDRAAAAAAARAAADSTAAAAPAGDQQQQQPEEDARLGLRAGAPLTVTGPNRIDYRFDSFALLVPLPQLWGPGAAAGREGVASGEEEESEAGRRAGRRAGSVLRVPLPAPRAGGWTQAVYVDRSTRVMRNSLGDTLVFVRQE